MTRRPAPNPEEGEVIRVRKRRRVDPDSQRDGKDYLRNKASLEFPDPWRAWRPILISLFLVIAVGSVAFLMVKLSGPSQGNLGKGLKQITKPAGTR